MKLWFGVKCKREDSQCLGALAFKADSVGDAPKGVEHFRVHGSRVNQVQNPVHTLPILGRNLRFISISHSCWSCHILALMILAYQVDI